MSTGQLVVDPPLDPRARRVLTELAGDAGDVRRIWRGQPPGRCPWSASPDGRELQVEATTGHAVAWLRFLLREVLAPTSRSGRARAEACGLTTAYGVSGRVDLPEQPGGPTVLLVGSGRVRESGRWPSRGRGGRGDGGRGDGGSVPP